MSFCPKSRLQTLAERCEAAIGPNVFIEAEIDTALFPESDAKDAPAYTASLDAAMTLVPEGMYPNIDCEPSAPEVEIYCVKRPIGSISRSYDAATPALALCAAALRARLEEK